MRRLLVLTAVACSAALFGCPSRNTVPNRALPAPVKIPEGCEADLSGAYTYPGRPGWSYAASDDGRTLTLEVEHAAPEGDAPAVDAGGSPGTRIVLERTPAGFVGTTRTTAYGAQGVACEVQFPTEIVACPEGGLRISAVETVAIDEACVRAKVPKDAPRAEHLLTKVPSREAEADGGSTAAP